MMANDPMAEAAFLKSNFYEQLVEHVFISEVLQEVWFGFGKTIEVLRSEVDSSGYDLVLECNRVLRHIQLKTSKSDAKRQTQNVNVALEEKASGCVVWLVRNEEQTTGRVRLRYLFFGDEAGQPLPPLNGFRLGKHTKGDSTGKKKVRTTIRLVPKSHFERIDTTRELVQRLFGLSERAAPVSAGKSRKATA